MNDFDKIILCRTIMNGTGLLTKEQRNLMTSRIYKKYYSNTAVNKINKALIKYLRNPQDKVYAMLLVKEIQKRL